MCNDKVNTNNSCPVHIELLLVTRKHTCEHLMSIMLVPGRKYLAVYEPESLSSYNALLFLGS